MSLILSTATKGARLQALADRLDAAATPGKLRLYGAPQPLAGAAPTGDVLAEVILSQPCGVVTDAALTLSIPPAAVAVADGDVAWGRLLDGDDNWVADGDAGAMASAAFIRLVNPHIYGGGLVGIASAVITE